MGSAVVHERIAAGHGVLGLARSDAGARAVASAGAGVQRGSPEDLDSLRSSAAAADGVIHAAFNHDFPRFGETCARDALATHALGEALAGSDRPPIVTSGLALVASGSVSIEEDAAIPASPTYPRVSEATALELAERRVNAGVVRLPPTVHGAGDHGFAPRLIMIAREKGVSA